MNNKEYVIFNVEELNKIDFTKVLETSIDTLRKSINGTKTFVKWIGEQPSFINTLITKEGPYTYEEILIILNTSEWQSENNI